MLLLTLGGVYADLDVYSVGPLAGLWNCTIDVGFVAVQETVLDAGATTFNTHSGRFIRPTRVANYFFASERANPIMAEILATAMSRVRAHPTAETQDDVILTTGPDAMTEGLFGGPPPSDALPSRTRMATRAEADLAVSHHARGGWRLQFEAFRNGGSYKW